LTMQLHMLLVTARDCNSRLNGAECLLAQRYYADTMLG